ncbi:hypothetical protein ABD87_22840 [Lysinibacillus sphaericus]|uniref:hypothetical protein n=1 Tax=Lysinibacillus sphaericus TaxID=1421 RepID=UPI0018CDDEB2|nr:hypothetical protein [Lysinibacillus sphaericus]MBG9732265.1 hypothetical protein [Lysinibacillus sphaericus]
MMYFQVGLPMPKEIEYQANTQTHWITYDANGLTLFIGFPNMTEKESDIFASGNFEIGFIEMSNIAFISFHFKDKKNPNLTIPYCDLAYHPQFLGVPADEYFDDTVVTKLKENSDITLAFNVIAFDSRTGIVKGQQIVALGSRFSIAFAECMERLVKSPIAKDEYMNKVLAVQARYNSKEIYKLAKYQYRHRGK